MRNGTPPDIEGFRYIRVLGRGGFAEVFLYEQTYPQRQVAVKVLRHDVDEEFRERFREEANVMAQVSTHPAIVTILGADVAPDGRPYLVMEYCPFKHMGERAKEDPLSVAEALKTGIQIAGAVESAHRLGIIHRDIKPANILVTAYRHPALTDFGISATADRSMSFGVSVPWAPPEQVEGAPATVRADVYSLAATLHHLLTGHSPFGGDAADKDMTLMAERVVRDPVPPITNRPDVPPAFEQVLMRAMSKDPQQRYGSAIDLARALQRVQHEIGLQVTQIEAMDHAVPPREVHYEDGGQTVIVAPKKPGEAPERWRREGELGQDPLVDSGSGVSSQTGPAHPRPPADDDSTRLRALAPPPDEDTDRTRLRAGAPVAPPPGRRIPVWLVAVAGLVVLAMIGAGVWFGVNRWSGDDAAADEAPTYGAPSRWRDLPEGSCLRDKWQDAGQINSLTPVYCPQEEYYTFLVLKRDYEYDAPYPGTEVLAQRITRQCEQTIEDYALVNKLDPADYEVESLAPAEHSWKNPDPELADRTYGCLAYRKDGRAMKGEMSGPDFSVVPDAGGSATTTGDSADQAGDEPAATTSRGVTSTS